MRSAGGLPPRGERTTPATALPIRIAAEPAGVRLTLDCMSVVGGGAVGVLEDHPNELRGDLATTAVSGPRDERDGCFPTLASEPGEPIMEIRLGKLSPADRRALAPSAMEERCPPPTPGPMLPSAWPEDGGGAATGALLMVGGAAAA